MRRHRLHRRRRLRCWHARVCDGRLRRLRFRRAALQRQRRPRNMRRRSAFGRYLRRPWLRRWCLQYVHAQHLQRCGSVHRLRARPGSAAGELLGATSTRVQYAGVHDVRLQHRASRERNRVRAAQPRQLPRRSVQRAALMRREPEAEAQLQQQKQPIRSSAPLRRPPTTSRARAPRRRMVECAPCCRPPTIQPRRTEPPSTRTLPRCGRLHP